ncbi:hypothetical protein Glove_363g25 [Diversispora epigaea]|uniref:Uncharacterized protein n=1 Tax=Diversispora epigaea TaxID=1348612 RepID=A0A397HGF3_9GLOM|nr:hypothetical protein Glove_363g25 [Diversispora epigaea]
MANIQSKVVSLEEQVFKLIAENTEIRKKYSVIEAKKTELKTKLEEIDDGNKTLEQYINEITLKLSNLKGETCNVEIGYLQNIMQLESAYHTNKKKRTADQAFQSDDYDYLYGIVFTAQTAYIVPAKDRIIKCDEHENKKRRLRKFNK